MSAYRFATFTLSTLVVAACAAAPAQVPPRADVSPRESDLVAALSSFSGAYHVSERAMRTAVRETDGAPVGLLAYEEPADAVRAGDMAAFIAAIRLETVRTGETGPVEASILSVDRAVAGDLEGARELLEPVLESEDVAAFAAFLNAWYLALDGRGPDAISAYRSVSGRLPGLTGDLSLAAMLEALGRTEEALAVYDAMIPREIVAPEHDFDPQGLVFGHIQLVTARYALLLRREGRIEEAQDLYRELAAAEPEKAVGYSDAIESLRTGRNLDDETLTLESAFARSLADYSLAQAYQRIFANAMIGKRLRGYDTQKGILDQLALLIDPSNDDLRLAIHDDLFDEALFESALHVLEIAPEPSADLKLSEASTLLRLDRQEDAHAALVSALELADTDEQLGISTAAMGLYSLMERQDAALMLAADLPNLAESKAERASAHGMSAAVFSQFARYDEALENAREARRLDDTHDRRLALADALADAGQVSEGLTLLRNEALSRPNDPYMLNTLGYYLVLHTDRLEEAFKVLARAAALAPNDPYIADSFGWVRYKLGDLEGARRYIEKSQEELAPSRNWEVEDHLGDIYWHLGREEDAKEAWSVALDEFPPETERALIEEKLANGLQEPPPEKRPLPDVSLEDDGEAARRDI